MGTTTEGIGGMTRQYIRWEHSESIDTEYGPVIVHALEDDRVRVESGEGFAFREQPYRVSGFLRSEADGTWADARLDRGFGLTFDRGWDAKPVPPTHEARMRVAIFDAVTKWATLNASTLAEAGKVWRNNEARGAEAKIAAAERYIKALREIVASNDAGATRSQYNVPKDISDWVR